MQTAKKLLFLMCMISVSAIFAMEEEGTKIFASPLNITTFESKYKNLDPEAKRNYFCNLITRLNNFRIDENGKVTNWDAIEHLIEHAEKINDTEQRQKELTEKEQLENLQKSSKKPFWQYREFYYGCAAGIATTLGLLKFWFRPPSQNP